MRKNEVFAMVSDKTNKPANEVKKIVEEFLEVIKDSTIKGESIFIRGFGTISTTIQKEKVGRILRTGEPIKIPAHRKLKFKPSEEWKEKLKSNS